MDIIGHRERVFLGTNFDLKRYWTWVYLGKIDVGEFIMLSD